jgi:hypothetical protein
VDDVVCELFAFFWLCLCALRRDLPSDLAFDSIFWDLPDSWALRFVEFSALPFDDRILSLWCLILLAFWEGFRVLWEDWARTGLGDAFRFTGFAWLSIDAGAATMKVAVFFMFWAVTTAPKLLYVKK